MMVLMWFKVIYAGLPVDIIDISVFLWLRKQQPSPRAIFKKDFDRTTEPIARMNVEWKVEKAERSEFTCQHVATLQFVSCAEEDNAYSRPHPCFGPNWFIQFCHTWRWIWYAKKSPPTETGKGRRWTPVFFCGCASKGQDSPKAIFKWTNSIEQLDAAIAGVNGRWGQVVEETARCHSATGETWKVTLDNWQCGA